jgi:ABC-type polysaccharide/polyol phosphate export permease
VNKKYNSYIWYSVRTSIRTRYIDTYMGFAWFFIDPLLQMLIYTFVFTYIFSQHIANYTVFVIIGVIVWRWFSGALNHSTNSIYYRLQIIEQVPVPKQILPLIDMLIDIILFLIGMTIVAVFLIIYQIPMTWHVLEFIPITIVVFTFLYGMSLYIAHIGAIVSDFKSILQHIIFFIFFLSPVMYSITTFPENIQAILQINPAVTFINSYRDALMYGVSPDYTMLGLWFVIGLTAVFFGIRLMKKYDKQYVKLK